MKKRIYFVPVKTACNADCSFCITKTQEQKIAHMPQLLTDTKQFADTLRSLSRIGIDEFEITGGGEPFLHKSFQLLIDMIKSRFLNSYIKVYTNGFILKEIYGIDELNISRVHWDSTKNNEIYQSVYQNNLMDALDFYRPLVSKIRLNIVMMKGYIDSEEKLRELINKTEDYVDTYFVRTLFSQCDLEKSKYVNFSCDHPKVKYDATGDYCGTQAVIGQDGKLYWNWDYVDEVDLEDEQLNDKLMNNIQQNKKERK